MHRHSDKATFHDTDTDILADILARIVARMSVSVSVSVSWNATHIQRDSPDLVYAVVSFAIYCMQRAAIFV